MQDDDFLDWASPSDDGGLIRDAIEDLFRDGSWAAYQGRATTKLIRLLSEWTGSEHVRLCSSGTAALELALRAGRIGPGDEVILCAYDFPGNLRTVEHVGARPVVVDCKNDQWVIDPVLAAAAATSATRAVIVSHLYGNIAPMSELLAWATERGILLIEDACQSPGGLYSGRSLGTWGNIGIFSFGGNKPLTAGNGGALMTNDSRLAQRAKVLAERPSDAFPLSQLQAAVLCPQLENLAHLADARRRGAADLTEQLADLDGWTSAWNFEESCQPDFYKLAWCAASSKMRDDALAQAVKFRLPVGAGYRSAGRLSKRRCHVPFPTPHADYRAQGTLVLDHRVLRATPDQLALLVGHLRAIM